MFEKEIKFIIDFTLNRISKLGSFFTYEKLASAEVHPAIILYISAQLDFLIYEDRKKLLQNSSFDYSGSEISKYFNLISEEIKKNKRLAFEDVRTLVAHAVTFNLNYLIRPNWTLSKLIFDENKTRNVNEIKLMLNYLYYYDYMKNVFYGYFSKRKIISLSESEFENILGKIDRQMFDEHTRDLIDNALVSIGDFFNEGGLNKTRISTQSVEIFLKEKNLTEELFKLRRSIPAEDKRKYDIDEIRKILYSREPVKVKPGKETKEEIPEETSEDAAGGNKDEPVPEAFTPAEESVEEVSAGEPGLQNEEMLDETEDIPEEDLTSEDDDKIVESESPDDFLSKFETELKSLEELEAQLRIPDSEEEFTFEELEEEPDQEPPVENHGTEEAGEEESLTFEEIMSEEPEPRVPEPKEPKQTQPEPVEPAPAEPKPVEPAMEDDEELSEELIIEEEEFTPFDEAETEESTPDTIPPAKKNNDILSFLSDKEMDKIVANVFNEDESDFVNTMEKISESATYDEATEILKAVFFSYRVSPYSKDAVSLTNAVSNFFSQE